MSEYKGIKGFQVTTRTEDPVPYAQALADNPYAGVFSSGGAMNTVRTRSGGTQAGTLTAGLVFGTPNSPKGQTEEYDGTSWTESGDLNTGRYISYGGGGTQTSAITAGGFNPPNPPGATNFVEQYNGTSWTETTEVNTARFDCSSFGTYNAMKLVGGATGPGSPNTTAFVEDWNGSAWTETTDLPTARQEHSSWGITTAGAIVGGSNDSTPTMTNETLEWDGSSWSEGGDYPTVLRYSTAFGSSTDALAAGGSDASSRLSTAAAYNGSAWTTVNSLATARDGVQGNGTGSSGFVAGGESASGETTATEEWTFSGLDPSSTPAAGYADAITGDFYYNSSTGSFKTVNTGGAPIGTWASGGTMNSARFLSGGAGATHSAALVFGGRNPALSPGPNSNFTESYDGTSWAETADMNVQAAYWAGMGTQTAALAVGGSPPATAGYTEQWNGSAWTAKNALTRGSATPQAATYGMGNGTTTSALFYGGDEGSNSQQRTEEWDGTNWTEVADLNTGRGYGAGFGTNAEDALCVGGLSYPPGNLAICESWNGSAWTEVGDLNTGRLLYNTSSTQAPSNVGLVYSGRNLSPNASFAVTESWNGTAWTEVADLATARRAGGGGGIGTNAILSGGSPNGGPAYTGVTEEFTAADFLIKTVTTS